MSTRTIAALAVVLFLSCSKQSASPPTADAAASEERPPLGRLPADVRPIEYALDLRIDPEAERFSGEVRIALELTHPRRVLWLHGRDLQVQSAVLTAASGRSHSARYTQVHEEGVARLELPEAVGAGRATLAIRYQGALHDKPRGLFRMRDGGRHYVFTQFEALDARRAFPGFDEPVFKVPFEVSLTVRREHVAIANTAAAGEEPAEAGWKRVRFARTEKLPTYLVALAVGPLDVVTVAPVPPNAARPRPLPLRGVAPNGKGGKLATALAWTPEIVLELERYFGIAYPYDKLDLVAVPGLNLAMENAGMITFTERALLVDPESAPIWQRRGVARVIAHELAHQWFGDLVTMPWWDDIWLNEAFATWMAYRAVHAWRPAYRSDIAQWESTANAMRSDSLASARQIRQPIESTHDIVNAFDAITYSKGGAVIGMFERYLGAEPFRRRVREHLQKYRFGHATSEQFLESIAGASPEVASAFRTFLLQPGVPLVDVVLSCARDVSEVSLRQSRYLPLGTKGERGLTWRFPVCLRYELGGKVQEKCVLASRAKERVALGKGCPAWLHPNAGGAGYYRFALGPQEYGKLSGAPFGRLEVRERLALADSVRAAVFAGRLPIADALRLLSGFAASKERAVSKTPMGILRFARDHLLPAPLRARLEEFGRRLYAGTLRDLGYRRGSAPEDDERSLFRKDVIEFLAKVARDPAVRRELSERAAASLGKDGRFRVGILDPDLLGLALGVAVQEQGAPFFDEVLKRIDRVRDELVRSQLLEAVGTATQPALAERVRSLMLSKFRSHEIPYLLRGQAGEPENAEGLWRWMRENFEHLAPRLVEEMAGYLPLIASPQACSEREAEELRRFFEPRIDKLKGGPRKLRMALERIAICAALVKEHAAGARKFFESVVPGRE